MSEGNEGIRDHFTMVPHLVELLNLTPNEFTLYVHYRRVCGELPDGLCWQSIRTIASVTHMSTGSVTKARRRLDELGLIKVVEVFNKHGGKNYLNVSLVDIWNLNHAAYRKQEASAPDTLVNKNMGISDLETIKNVIPSEQNALASARGEAASARGEIKNNPRRILLEEKPSISSSENFSNFPQNAPTAQAGDESSNYPTTLSHVLPSLQELEQREHVLLPARPTSFATLDDAREALPDLVADVESKVNGYGIPVNDLLILRTVNGRLKRHVQEVGSG
jgi:hypothetical protein